MLSVSHVWAIHLTSSYEQSYKAFKGNNKIGGIYINTPLNILIQRLEKPWRLEGTDEMTVIGYTDDMYSIATYGEKAIDPLLAFVDTAKNIHAKYGSVFTLYLIGTNGKPGNRLFENFYNKKARTALLSLLSDKDVGETAMSLLLRDPWQSDVRLLMLNINQDPSSWYVVSALNQYHLPDYPLDGPVPENIKNLTYDLGNAKNPNEQLYNAIYSIKRSRTPLIDVDDQLLKYKELWGNDQFGLDGVYYDSYKNTIAKLLSCIISTFYSTVGSKINYFIKNDELYLCSPEKSRKIVLEWWKNKPTVYKEQFVADSSYLAMHPFHRRR